MCDIEKRFPDYVQQPHYQILNNTTDTLSIMFPMQEQKQEYEIGKTELYSHIVQIKPYPVNAQYPKGYLEEWIKCIDGVEQIVPCSLDINDNQFDYLLVIFQHDEYKVNRGIQLLRKEINGTQQVQTEQTRAIAQNLTAPQLVKQLVTELVRLAWLMRSLPTEQRKQRLQQLVQALKEKNNESTK